MINYIYNPFKKLYVDLEITITLEHCKAMAKAFEKLEVIDHCDSDEIKEIKDMFAKANEKFKQMETTN